jgi:hypothetical protein
MAYQPTRPVLTGVRLLTAAGASEATRSAWSVFWPTRLGVLLVAVFAALSLGDGDGLGARNETRFDAPELTHPVGGVGELLLSPLARWDAVWYLEIAGSGYAGEETRAAFFPLYPLLVRAAGTLGGGSEAALLLAAYVVSLASLLGALYLLHRLVTLELGRPLARPTLLLLAVFPGSLYFGAPYSESLFLLVSIGAFYAARTDAWGWAGVCAGAAAATRSAGILLLVPLAILWLRRQPRRVRDAAWLLLGPAGLAAYATYLGLAQGDALAFLDVQDAWHRELAAPLGGAWDGLVAAWDGARQLLSGSRKPVFFERAGGDPFRVAGMNLMLFGFLAFALIACAGALRRLPLPYGAYVACALVLPLSFPAGPQPLMSLPRFVAVLFPLFMWLAIACEERRITERVAALSALVLGLFVTEFATWHFVA